MFRFGSTAPPTSGTPVAPPRKSRLGDAIKDRIDNAIGNLTGATDRIRALETHKDQLEGQLGNLQVMNAQNQAQVADLLAALQTCRTEVESGNALNAYMMHKLEDAEKKVVEFSEFESHASKLIEQIFESQAQDYSEKAPPRYDESVAMDVAHGNTDMRARMSARVDKTPGPAAQATTVVHVHMHEPAKPARVELPRFVPTKPASPPKPLTILEKLKMAREQQEREVAMKKQEEADRNMAAYMHHSSITESRMQQQQAEIEDMRSKITANRMTVCFAVQAWLFDMAEHIMKIEMDKDMPKVAKDAALKALPTFHNLTDAACFWRDVTVKRGHKDVQPNKELDMMYHKQNLEYLKKLNDMGCEDSVYDFYTFADFEANSQELNDPELRRLLFPLKTSTALYREKLAKEASPMPR